MLYNMVRIFLKNINKYHIRTCDETIINIYAGFFIMNR